MKLDADTLEHAAKTLEQRHGNPIYKQAWRTAARLLRSMKGQVLTGQPESLIDQPEQISSTIGVR